MGKAEGAVELSVWEMGEREEGGRRESDRGGKETKMFNT